MKPSKKVRHVFSQIKLTYLLILVWYCNMLSSTSFIDILPLKMAATVRYRPLSGLQAAIMLLGWNIFEHMTHMNELH